MPLGEIIEKAYKITWKNRALWFYGILLTIFSGGGSSNFDLTEEQANSILGRIPQAALIPILIGAGVFLFIFLIVSLIVSSWSEAALIKGVKKIDEGKEVTRKEIGKTGKRSVWKLIVLNFFIPFGIALALVLLILLGVLGVVALQNQAANSIGIALLVILALVLIPVLVYFGMVWLLAAPYVVLEGKNVIESLKAAYKLLRGKFWWTLLFNIIIGIIAAAIAMGLMIPLAALGLGSFLSFTNDIFALGGVLAVVAVVYLVFFIFVLGVVQTFARAGQTLWWLELRKQKSV